MWTIAIINQKGGCGKTTTAINLSGVLARQGRRVLLADLDPQGHCAAGMGIPEQRIDLDIGDALMAAGQRTIDLSRLLWRPARNLDLAPSRMRLAGLEAARGGLADAADRELRLRKAIASLSSNYDFCCIDCPPSIGLLTYNSIAAADMVVIPVETSFFSLQGATRQLNTVRSMARRLGLQLPVWVLPTIHDTGNAVANDLLDELFKRFKGRVVPVVIRRDPLLREAASFGQTILDYAPTSSGTEDYTRLGTWIADHLRLGDAAPIPAELVSEDPAIDAELFSAASEVGATAPLVTSATPSSLDSGAQHAAVAEPQAVATATPATEVKSVSRAEDVARRAQEFLRKVALSRTTPNALPKPIAEAEPSESAAATANPNVLKLVAPEVPRATSISPTTQRLLGITYTNQGILFVQPVTMGDSISIAGTFNDWSATTHPMRRNPSLGVYELCLRLPPGRFRYRLVVDGVWTADPYNNQCEPNPFGETDSILTVASPIDIAM